MAFPRTPQTWADGSGGGTPVSSARLNDIESGVQLAAVYGISSSPPGSPVDGMIWRLAADSSKGIYWFFQYDSSQSTNKWVFMGGSPWEVEVATDEGTSSTSYVDLPTVGPSITVPRAGDYLVEHGADIYNTTAAVGTLATVKLGAAAASDNEAIGAVSAAASNSYSLAMVRLVALAASDVVKQQVRVTGGTGHARRRWLKITPRRVI